jgi:hypothetical protein
MAEYETILQKLNTNLNTLAKERRDLSILLSKVKTFY